MCKKNVIPVCRMLQGLKYAKKISSMMVKPGTRLFDEKTQEIYLKAKENYAWKPQKSEN